MMEHVISGLLWVAVGCAATAVVALIVDMIRERNLIQAVIVLGFAAFGTALLLATVYLD